jgi:superfamily II DNA/RNA helicase
LFIDENERKIYSVYRFLQLIGQIMTLRDGKTLVFCQTKRRVDEIYRLTKQMGFPVVSLILF